MNSHDQDRIDAVLQALGQAEPAAGMQQRITAVLHHAEQSRNAKATRRLPGLLRFPHTNVLPRLAVATVVVVAATALLLHARHRARPDIAHGSGIALAHRSAPRLTGKEGAVSGLQRHATGDLQAAVPALPIEPDRAHPFAVDSSLQNAPEEQSFPAPPLPLTEQERLLIRLIHREAPIQLAQLTTPAINAARQQETDAVTAFFASHEPVIEELKAPTETAAPGGGDPAQNPQDKANKEIQ